MGVVPVDRHYYLDAMAAFRDHFAESAVRVVFVFVSDDMRWGRRQLKNERDLYFVGNGDGVDPDAIGRDLALLAACNHTIQVFPQTCVASYSIFLQQNDYKWFKLYYSSHS